MQVSIKLDDEQFSRLCKIIYDFIDEKVNRKSAHLLGKIAFLEEQIKKMGC